MKKRNVGPVGFCGKCKNFNQKFLGIAFFISSKKRRFLLKLYELVYKNWFVVYSVYYCRIIERGT